MSILVSGPGRQAQHGNWTTHWPICKYFKLCFCQYQLD